LSFSVSLAIRYATLCFCARSPSYRIQFGGQEPGDDAAISEFCTLNHGVTFPLMKKSDVNGDSTNEVFKWLKNEKSGLLGLTRIKVLSSSFLGLSKSYRPTVELREVFDRQERERDESLGFYYYACCH
jgi:hypothetical protein